MSTTDREENRRWLERGIAHDPDGSGWEALYVDIFGWEGALDLLSLQDARVVDVNLSHKPFASNAELKYAVYDAREAVAKVQRMAFEVGLDEVRRVRYAREAEAAALAFMEAQKEAEDG